MQARNRRSHRTHTTACYPGSVKKGVERQENPEAWWPASLAQQWTSGSVRLLYQKMKVEGHQGKMSNANLWPLHTGTSTSTYLYVVILTSIYTHRTPQHQKHQNQHCIWTLIYLGQGSIIIGRKYDFCHLALLYEGNWPSSHCKSAELVGLPLFVHMYRRDGRSSSSCPVAARQPAWGQEGED